MRHKEFWVALTFGALAGAVAALLYAPRSGASTRRKLRRGIDDLSGSIEEAGDYLKDQAERLSKEAQKLLDASKDQFGSALGSASGVVKSANKVVSKLV